MKKRILMAGVMAVTAISVLAGAYAFFTDKKDIKVLATAAKLGISKTTLWRKLRQYQII